MRRKSYIFFTFWVIVVLILGIVSIRYNNSTDAIVAVVEPQRIAISYPKAVKLEKIYVVPGQEIHKNDTLFKAVRPELSLDIEKTTKSLESSEAEKKKLKEKFASEISLLMIEKQSKINEIVADVEQIEAQVVYNKKRMEQLITISGDSINEPSTDLQAEMKIKSLKREKSYLAKYYNLAVERKSDQLTSELEIIDFKMERLSQEIEVLRNEEAQLIQISKEGGTIGNIYVETDEIVPPYENIVSIYVKNPTVIKAFINEQTKKPIKVGDAVSVESSSRGYQTDGEVIEIGSRIVRYPDRLQVNQEQRMWGQEIFIRISKENNFLNGEKVYVSVKN